MYEKSNQDKFLSLCYKSRAGRLVFRMISGKAFSDIGGVILSSWPSSFFISGFVRRNNISLKDYQKKKYTSFNDFFMRKIKEGKRPVCKEEGALVSPCDGYVTVLRADEDGVYNIKGNNYTLKSLLRNNSLAEYYYGGHIIIVRLRVDDYHHYGFASDVKRINKYKLQGRYYTVNPVAFESTDVFAENTREIETDFTDDFEILTQVEVGALNVGKIVNDNKKGSAKRGEEKGHFEFGGSTVVLLVKKGVLKIREDILAASEMGDEFKIKMGEKLGNR
ncbi:MAG: phosphatidylserine decarboxylase [Lachnospiraceae bacterium]|nr:phosphatidylserine decarboxylase [Lachnospiraceae bacterium]